MLRSIASRTSITSAISPMSSICSPSPTSFPFRPSTYPIRSIGDSSVLYAVFTAFDTASAASLSPFSTSLVHVHTRLVYLTSLLVAHPSG